MKHKSLPAEARINELLRYNAKTGILVWRVSPTNRVAAGAVAGTLMTSGYIHVQIDGILYLAHRLIWLIVHHVDPGVSQIDHDNRIRSDNRKRNLKLAERREFDNMQNMSKRKDCVSGVPGVCWDQSKQKWRAYIGINGRLMYLGYFKSKAAAIRTRREAKACHHTYHPT